mmetsp:Transcript_36174/g.62112  ORF Transcript_36174/g.62112 Transcript_36174/m.62112 type:complete len:209 (+) Transcript_36174:1135-1761(+)
MLDRSVPLGRHHKRGVVLPMAVSERGGPVQIHVSAYAGCSSLLPMNRSTRWGRHCLQALETRTVPSVSLTSALRLAGKLPVKLLKLDAQGLDARLLMATAPELLSSRVHAVVMEMVPEDCNALYEGQARCSAVLAFMGSVGFHARNWSVQHADPAGNLCRGWRRRGGRWFEVGRSSCEAETLFVNERSLLRGAASRPPTGYLGRRWES